MNKNTNKISILFIALLAIFAGNFCYSAEIAETEEIEYSNPQYSINLDKETIAKGYTVSAFEDSLKLSLVPGILNESTGVLVEDIQTEMETPWNLNKISKIYQFEFLNKQAYDDHKPFYIQFSYNKESDKYKRVFFYDKNYNTWRPLPTTDFPEENFVRSLIHLPFARIAIFEDPEMLTVGRASWYAYKGGDFVASPDFPKGSRLRVYNMENEKFVDVEVNDYGPDRSIFPDRAVDLDKLAFAKLASLGEGVIDVRVEPLYIAPENGTVLGVSEVGATSEPEIKAKSFVLFDVADGRVIYEDNAEEVLPLASLTKIVSAKVLLDTGVDLKKEIAYSVKDEEYNYEYCSKWESARLRVSEGDVMTVEDLLYSAIVGSANNAVETFVRASGLSREEFIQNMNEYVHTLGATSTKFIEPTGLSPDNVSSSLDYAIIINDALSNPLLSKVSSTAEYIFYTLNTEVKHTIRNTNNLVRYNDLGIVGSKTGYLHEAGYCIAVRSNYENNEMIAIAFGADTREESFENAEALIKYGTKLIK